MTPETVPLYYHLDYEMHSQVHGHPESPERVKEIMRFIQNNSLSVEIKKPVEVRTDELQLVHSMSHIDRVRDFGVGYMDPDTFHTDETYGYCMRAAGGVVGAVRQCIEEKRPTFAIPRPPGHHAGFDYNMGFCYFNNCALASKLAQKEYDDINKVAIVDIDAHHGNGTNDIFYDDPSTLYISTHEWGIFPGTGHQTDVGSGEGEGKTMNLPLKGGSGDGTFLKSFDEIVLPAIKEFSPDLLIVSYGGDSHLMDPLTTLSLSTHGYLKLSKDLLDLGKEIGGRVCIELEGGYHTYALAESFGGAMAMAAGDEIRAPVKFDRTRDTAGDTDHVKELKDTLSSYWRI